MRALYHPQFHRRAPDVLIYSADPPDPRLWTVRIDGRGDRCMYANPRDQWFVHETFLGRTDRVAVVSWHRGIREVDLSSGAIHPLAALLLLGSVTRAASAHDRQCVGMDLRLVSRSSAGR